MPLLKYRLHEEQTIQKRKERLIVNSNRVRREIFRYEFGEELGDEQLPIHYAYFNEVRSSSLVRIEQLAAWRKQLLRQSAHSVKKEGYHRLINRFWLRQLYTLSEYRPRAIGFLFDSCIAKEMSKGLMLRFIIKSLIFYRVRN